MTTWINITELLQWHGNLTGIQRIEYNLAKLYLESDKDVQFFAYEEENRKFKEVEFVPDELVKLGIANKPINNTESPVYLKKITKLAHRLKRKTTKSARSLKQEIGVPFKTNDTVLVIGSIWTGSFADDLIQAKSQYNFKLAHFAFDMIPAILPGFVVDWLPEVFINYHKKIFSHSDMILCISKSTSNDVKRFLQDHSIQNDPIIEIVRIGENIDAGDKKPIKGLKPGFLLSVSTIESRKNHAALFYMLQEARRRQIVLPKIVIVGRNGWHTEDFRYVVEHDPVAREGIMIINDADDATLSWLYHNCLFTIFPSFYEGWGMPIAESLAHGKLCLSSDTSSMPEIAGDLIDYFSPYDIGSMLEKTKKYLDKERLQSKENKIKSSYTQTNWHDTFNQVSFFIDAL